jgi:hypothetical protein
MTSRPTDAKRDANILRLFASGVSRRALGERFGVPRISVGTKKLRQIYSTLSEPTGWQSALLKSGQPRNLDARRTRQTAH